MTTMKFFNRKISSTPQYQIMLSLFCMHPLMPTTEAPAPGVSALYNKIESFESKKCNSI